MSPLPDISVVIPLYNERESLAELHAALAGVVKQHALSAEFIFIDDGSTDGSFAELEKLHKADPRVRVLQFRRNYGKAAALSQGFMRARGKYVVTIDADLQDEPEEIPRLIAKLEEGYDLVSGWKKKRHDPFVKRVTSKIFNRVTSLLTGVQLHDMNCGLKIYRAEAAKSLQIYGQRHRFLPVLAAQSGFTIGELVVQHHARRYGKTKYGPSRFLSGFLDLVTLLFLSRYIRRPLHLFGGLGLLTFLAGTAINLYLSYERIIHQKYLTNRPLLFLGVLLIIVGIQFFSLGLLGEMITEARSDEVKYSIKAEVGFTPD